MEDFLEIIFEIPFVTGLCFMAAGAVMHRFPPKKINGLYGYRTASSMKSQQAWDFSQRYSAIQMMRLGLFMALFAFLGCLFPPHEPVEVGVGLIFLLIAVLYLFLKVERQIKKRFNT